jgi:hypothetical protein
MADGELSNVIRDIVFSQPGAMPLRVIEQSPCGRHDFPQDDEPSVVEIDGGRVLIRGRLFHTFMSVSNAARVASALTTLDAFGLLDRVSCPSRDHPTNPALRVQGAQSPSSHADLKG